MSVVIVKGWYQTIRSRATHITPRVTLGEKLTEGHPRGNRGIWSLPEEGPGGSSRKCKIIRVALLNKAIIGVKYLTFGSKYGSIANEGLLPFTRRSSPKGLLEYVDIFKIHRRLS